MSTTAIQPNMIAMINKAMFEDGDKLFYELGHKKNVNVDSYGENWIRSGQFKEIENPIQYIENDKLLDNDEYLKHHNFMIIKKTII